MSKELSIYGKITTADINYLSKIYAKEGEPLIDRSHEKNYLNSSANNFISELYNSKVRVMELIEIFARSK